jgi:hypothetical protein
MWEMDTRASFFSKDVGQNLGQQLGQKLIAVLTGIFSVAAMLAGDLSAYGAGPEREHLLIRQVAVFPLLAPKEFSTPAEDAWWQAREELTKSHRFLVASKQFLLKNDVFQPRGDLDPADAIILGKVLDAHALITLQLKDKNLTMTVYDGGLGTVLWQKSVALHASLVVADQLAQMSKRIMDDFIASIPYQGFTVIDSLVGQPIFEEGDVNLAEIDIGANSGALIGDVVQWIHVLPIGPGALFQDGGKTTVFAEGKIAKLDQNSATVEIIRASNLKEIKENSLVRLPREAEHLQAEYTIHDNVKTTLTAELVAPEMSPMEKVAKERRPLITTLSFIASAAAFLLLAF